MKDKELNKEAKRMLDLIDSGSTSMISEDVAPYYVDISTYSDGELFELEKKKLFRERPLFMALSCDIRNPGDFVTNEDTGIPIIITRNKKEEIKAYLNVCRHRAGRLIDELESLGIVSGYSGSKARDVLVDLSYLKEIFNLVKRYLYNSCWWNVI